jgi:hypothetical protein
MFISSEANVANILEEYIAEAKYTLKSLLVETQSIQIEELAANVFNEDGSMDNRAIFAQFYNEEQSLEYISRGFTGFTLARQFNYMLTFFIKYFDKIKTLTNLYIIKGLWFSRDFPSELSTYMQEVQEAFQNLSMFDHKLSEQGEYGAKIKTLLAGTKSGNRFEEQLHRLFYNINQESQEIIKKSVNKITTMHKSIKTLKDDEKTQLHTVMRNYDVLASLVRSLTKDIISLDECEKKITALLTLIEYIDTIVVNSESA